MHRNILIGALVALIAYGCLTAFAVNKARAYRKAPSSNSEILIANAGGWLPHNAVATAIMLHDGSPAYRIQMRTDLYLNLEKERFSPWTRIMLRHDFKTMNDAEFNLFIGSYPDRYEKVHERIFRNFQALYLKEQPQFAEGADQNFDEQSAKDLSVLQRLMDVLNRYPQGQAAFLSWYHERIEAPGDKGAFATLVGDICQFQGIDYGTTFPRLIDKMEDSEWTLHVLSRCVPIDGISGDSFSKQYQRLARRAPDKAVRLLPFISRVLRVDGRPLTPGETAATTRLVAGRPRCDVSGLFAVNRRSGDDEDEYEDESGAPARKPVKSDTVFRPDDVKALFDLGVRRHDQCGHMIFGWLAHRDLPLAEKLFEPYARAPDSGLRKDMIVHLVNSESKVGMRLIDSSFTGAAPRTAQFESVIDYIENSKAAAAYNKLARHDYMETGKQYPPVYKDGAPSSDERQRWGAFIQTYPWFPGADDAYYRLAYAADAAGDTAGALDTLRSYSRLDLPDQDAEPFMLELVGAIADREALSPTLPEDQAYELAVAKAYFDLPQWLALDPAVDPATCAGREDAFARVRWLDVLRTTPERLYPDEESFAGPPQAHRTLCQALFGASDAEGVTRALEEEIDAVAVALTLPAESETSPISEQGMQRLTTLNKALAERLLIDITIGSTSARALGWFNFLTMLNDRYDRGCEGHSGAYCASVAAYTATKTQLDSAVN